MANQKAPAAAAEKPVDTVAEIRSILLSEAQDLLSGAVGDVSEFAGDIAVAISMAAADKDTEWARELRAQLRELASQHRVRVDAAGWRVLDAIVTTIAKIGLGRLGVPIA